MSECQQILRAQGKPYPRTCRVCQLGPCVHGHMTAPSDPRDAELAALKAEITGLRAERDAALAEGAVIGRMNAMKDAEAQIGRLREALRWSLRLIEAQRRAIPSEWVVTDVSGDWDDMTADEIIASARAALEPKP